MAPNHRSTDPSYTKLINTALRLVTRNPGAREQALAAAIAEAEAQREDARLQAGETIAPPDGSTVPAQIIHTLRSMPGKDRLVVVHHEGMRISALLHPIGRPNPEREEAVWRCLRDTAISVRDERRQR